MGQYKMLITAAALWCPGFSNPASALAMKLGMHRKCHLKFCSEDAGEMDSVSPPVSLRTFPLPCSYFGRVCFFHLGANYYYSVQETKGKQAGITGTFVLENTSKIRSNPEPSPSRPCRDPMDREVPGAAPGLGCDRAGMKPSPELLGVIVCNDPPHSCILHSWYQCCCFPWKCAFPALKLLSTGEAPAAVPFLHSVDAAGQSLWLLGLGSCSSHHPREALPTPPVPPASLHAVSDDLRAFPKPSELQ